jgi:hypothetical protein
MRILRTPGLRLVLSKPSGRIEKGVTNDGAPGRTNFELFTRNADRLEQLLPEDGFDDRALMEMDMYVNMTYIVHNNGFYQEHLDVPKAGCQEQDLP